MSLALGDRYNYYMKKSTDRINLLNTELTISIESERSENRRKTKLLKQLKKLIYPHQVEMISEKGKELEETMPVSSSEVACISFDIQSSSKIGHTTHHDFFEDVMKSCHRLMTSYYDKENLKANAYMIKEMGDGFICSVGFPFECSGNPKQNAFALSESFIRIFDRLALKYFPDKEVFCSVGVAYGEVSGYFPKSGLKQYDLYGEAIIKATRYESFRKHLFQAGIEKGNVLIIQKLVYDDLSKEMQESLTPFNLDDVKIRDDAEATKVYFKSESQYNRNSSIAS